MWLQSTLAWSGPHCDPWRGGERPAAMAALRVGGGVAPEGGRPRRSASRRLARRRAPWRYVWHEVPINGRVINGPSAADQSTRLSIMGCYN